MFLILVDAHSKWLEVYPMSSTTSTAVIQRLRTVFAQFGLPATIVTDNGPNFTSLEFKEFLCRNGIAHVTSSPYHPASNGLAERAMKTFKEGMRKIKEGTLSERIARFLLTIVSLHRAPLTFLQLNSYREGNFVPDWISSNLTLQPEYNKSS